MSIKSIPLKTWEVQAILDNRKSTLRRVVNKKYENTDLEMFTNKYGTRLVERQNDAPPDEEIIMQDGQKGTRRHLVAMREIPEPYHPGDILWVRETWQQSEGETYFYKANGVGIRGKWNPSIHMPKSAARLFLRVKSVRVERLQEITEDGALAEGIPDEWPMSKFYCPVCNGEGQIGTFHPVSLGHMDIDCNHCGKATKRFENLWNSTIKPADLPRCGWDTNPWVWVVEFERCEKPEGWL